MFASADTLRSHEAPGRSGAKLSFSWYSAMIEVENNTALQKRETEHYQWLLKSIKLFIFFPMNREGTFQWHSVRYIYNSPWNHYRYIAEDIPLHGIDSKPTASLLQYLLSLGLSSKCRLMPFLCPAQTVVVCQRGPSDSVCKQTHCGKPLTCESIFLFNISVQISIEWTKSCCLAHSNNTTSAKLVSLLGYTIPLYFGYVNAWAALLVFVRWSVMVPGLVEDRLLSVQWWDAWPERDRVCFR